MMDGSFLSKCEPSWELGLQVRLFYGTLTGNLKLYLIWEIFTLSKDYHNNFSDDGWQLPVKT